MSIEFRIAVNEKPKNVVSLIESRYKMYRRSARTYFISGNIVEIYYNENYDKALSESEDGWLYYNTHMDFVPIEKVTVYSQIELAENIKNFFDSRIIESEVIFCMDMIDFFAKEYNENDWKKYSECFHKADIKVDGVSQDVVNPVICLTGSIEWLHTPLTVFDGKTAVELEQTETGRKALRAFIMRLPT